MLFRSDVAEHGGAVPSDHGCADGGGNVVIAGSYIGDQRAQRVEGRFVAQLDFLFDLLLDLVHGNVAGTFDHDLHVVFPGFLGEFAQSLQFGELGFVTGVGDATGAEAVSEREADVVLLENLDDVVEAVVEKILFVIVGHPLGENGSASADDAGDALGNQRKILDQHAGMDRHVIDALRGLLFDHFQHDFCVQVFYPLYAGDGFVDRDGADRNGGVAQNGFANLVDVAAGGKVHNGVSAVVHGGVQLFEFFVYLRGDGGVADVGIDFAERCHPDRHGLEFRMVDVGGNNHASAGDFVADEFGCQLFFVGDIGHLFRHDSLARVVHLRKIAAGVFLLASGQPFCAWLGDAGTVAAISISIAIRGCHDRTSLLRNSVNFNYNRDEAAAGCIRSRCRRPTIHSAISRFGIQHSQETVM